MRLLPDSPFLLFYRDQGVNYWLLQSFSSAGSVTTTVVAKEPVPASQVKPSITQCIPHASGHLRLRSAFLLSPSAHCLHTLLQHSHQESFIAALFHQTACEASADLDLTPASSTACDLLLRYAPQSSSALLLEADPVERGAGSTAPQRRAPGRVARGEDGRGGRNGRGRL